MLKISPLIRYKLFLWYFSQRKVPLIGYVRPSLSYLDNNKVIIKLSLNRRTKNHLGSMYFGALAVGADLAGGLHAYYHAHQENIRLSLVFKQFSAEFLRRAEHDVFFCCSMGEAIHQLVLSAHHSKERMTAPISVSAYCMNEGTQEEIARFILELSVKCQMRIR